MAHLDNSTITVDAILTKQGRKLLAEGGSIDVKYFCLTDTGIDYNLWNVDHPSGSAYYGEAIESLPNLEALPQSEYFMRNKLMTLNKNVVALPVISGIADHSFGATFNLHTFTPVLSNATEAQGFYMIVPDDTLVSVTGAKKIDIAGNALTFINEQDIPNATMYKGTSFKVTPKTVTSTRTMSLVFVSVSFGTWATADVTINKNEVQVTVTTNPQGPVG